MKNPEYLLAAPMFPLGLMAAAPSGEKAAVWVWLLAGPLMPGGWLLYGVLSAVVLKAKRPGVFFLAYAILCLLLALNLHGCNQAWSVAHGIH